MRPDLRFLKATPWLMEPGRLQLLVAQLERVRDWPTAAEVAAERERRLDCARQVAAKAMRAVKGKVGIIPMHGPVQQRLGFLGMLMGGTSTEEIGLSLDYLLADASVDAVVLHVDSPGGESYGVEELSSKIYEARARKPIYAIADSMAASAAYWIATAASQVICTPGGDVGSVGVYAMHVDESAALEQEGVKVSFVSAGKYKVEGSPFAPLEDEARAHVQSQVDATYGKFLDALKRNRGTTLEDVRKNYGQGRVLAADQALAAGMLDKVMSFEALLGKLTGAGAGTSGARRASAEVLRLRHQARKRRDRMAA